MSDDTDDRPIRPARETDEEYLAELARQHAEALPAGAVLTEPEAKPLEGEFVPAGPEELAEALNSMVPDQTEAAAPAAEPAPATDQQAEAAPEEPLPPAEPASAEEPQEGPAEEDLPAPPPVPATQEQPAAPLPAVDEQPEPAKEEEQPLAAPLPAPRPARAPAQPPAPVEAISARPAIPGRQTAPSPLLRLLLQVLAVAALGALAAALHLMTG